MTPKLPDPKKLLPDLSALLDPFHPDNLLKPQKRRSALESYLGPTYKEKLRNKLRMDPGAFPLHIREKLVQRQPLSEQDQHTILENMG